MFSNRGAWSRCAASGFDGAGTSHCAVGDAVNLECAAAAARIGRAKPRWVPYHFFDELISKHLPGGVTDDLGALRGQDLFFIPQECNTRVLNGGWHWDGVGEPRSLEFSAMNWRAHATIGSGGVLILSPAPDPSGVFPKRQEARLMELRRWIDGSFRDNLLRGARIEITGGREGYAAEQLLREERDHPCLAAVGVTNLTISAEFPEPRTFNNLVLEEFLEPGQRISAFALDAWQDGHWTTVAEGRTAGRKRVLPFADTTTSRARFQVLAARGTPAVRFLGLYRALPYRENARVFAGTDYLRRCRSGRD